MNTEAAARRLAGNPAQPFLRVWVFYLCLFAVIAVLVSLAPGTLDYLNAPLPTSMPFGLDGGLLGATGGVPEVTSPWRAVVGAVVSLASASLLMLPVTWIYVQTRRKKGFEQSLVQTLIILPLVVAGVILLVQHSTALAFSLGGIVGAVSFRNTLRDTKDTIYIFLAIVIGVAAGVHALVVGITISVCFNIVAVMMWRTDFGRTGALLEGAPAADRLKRAKEMANRTGGFVSMVDRELLRSMTAEQLEGLAVRARARQHKALEKAELSEKPETRREHTVRIESGADGARARRLAEGLLTAQAKRFDLVSEGEESGGWVFVYRVRLRKSVDPDQFLELFRGDPNDPIQRATFAD